MVGFLRKQVFLFLIFVFVLDMGFKICFGHESHAHHHCSHGHDHGHHYHHPHDHEVNLVERKLPEELAEEEDLKLYGFESQNDHDHDHDHEHHTVNPGLSGVGLWIHAMGCSLLVSMASLICLIILPLIFVQGKPSKAVVDALAVFGAGAMLGDAFLHQLPHAFGGEHSHVHDHHGDHAHNHQVHNGLEHSHSHSLNDLSVGLSTLAGIVLFLIVEKVVRYIDELSSKGAISWSQGHHQHHHYHHGDKGSKKLKNDDDDANDNMLSKSLNEKNGKNDDGMIGEEHAQHDAHLRYRNTNPDAGDDKTEPDASKTIYRDGNKSFDEKESSNLPSNLVFGYLNLFSDGVHNFTDGIALGSAFLLYGSIGGWSRTLFLLAHELPQEVGDFGILVRSGFSVSKALFFNFLSALVALAGTALALLLGKDPGQSSLIEGFTAGGFVYIAVAGVLAEMNNGKSVLRNTVIQLTSLLSGMAVALCISLVE